MPKVSLIVAAQHRTAVLAGIMAGTHDIKRIAFEAGVAEQTARARNAATAACDFLR